MKVPHNPKLQGKLDPTKYDDLVRIPMDVLRLASEVVWATVRDPEMSLDEAMKRFNKQPLKLRCAADWAPPQRVFTSDVLLRLGLLALPFAAAFVAYWVLGHVGYGVAAYLVMASFAVMLNRKRERRYLGLVQAEGNRDKGVYRKLRDICYSLNLTPQELTAGRLLLMLGWFTSRSRHLLEAEVHRLEQRELAEQRDASLRAARIAEERRQKEHRDRLRYGTGRAARGGRPLTDTELATQAVRNAPWSEPSADPNHGWAINPATGQAMVSGSVIDVSGNVFGTDAQNGM